MSRVTKFSTLANSIFASVRGMAEKSSYGFIPSQAVPNAGKSEYYAKMNTIKNSLRRMKPRGKVFDTLYELEKRGKSHAN